MQFCRCCGCEATRNYTVWLTHALRMQGFACALPL